MICDRIYKILDQHPDGLSRDDVATLLNPNLCGQKRTDLLYTVDRECAKLYAQGLIDRKTVDRKPFYKVIR
jgi:hypothetical protein